jgi:ElaB/YqjD/DUF883 family membrane-anchored ribosome-binding protein
MSRRSEVREMSDATDRIMKNIKGFAGGAEELLRATAHFSGEGLAATRAKVAEQLEELRETMGDAGDFTLEQTKRAAREADHYVHRNPWQAIGVAMAVGVALGWLSRRN